MKTPLAEQGRAASEWRSTLERPEHGHLVVAFYRNDKGQGVDFGVFDQGGRRLILQKAKNTVLENAAEVAVPWSRYSMWAYVWFPPQETLKG